MPYVTLMYMCIVLQVKAKGSCYCQTQKTVNTVKISGMLIVHWPITIKFRTREQTSKPQTNHCCCLQFCFHARYWLISRNTITFHKYFWSSQFCEFHSKNPSKSYIRGTQQGYSSKPLNIALLNIF